MGPLSDRWRQSGNDYQCLAAPIWKYRSGFGDHRFNFFIDLRPNYTFYTNLTNIVDWVVAYRDVAHLVRLNVGKSWEKSAKSFDAGLSSAFNNSTLTHWPLLTLNVRGPSYLSLTRSISWLLMSWLLTSPGHQQPWYWLCKICRSWSFLMKELQYLCHVNVE